MWVAGWGGGGLGIFNDRLYSPSPILRSLEHSLRLHVVLHE